MTINLWDVKIRNKDLIVAFWNTLDIDQANLLLCVVNVIEEVIYYGGRTFFQQVILYRFTIPHKFAMRNIFSFPVINNSFVVPYQRVYH